LGGQGGRASARAEWVGDCCAGSWGRRAGIYEDKRGEGDPVALMDKEGHEERDIPRHSSNNCIVSVLIGNTLARSLSADKT
jgi:hypothetical protein